MGEFGLICGSFNVRSEDLSFVLYFVGVGFRLWVDNHHLDQVKEEMMKG